MGNWRAGVRAAVALACLWAGCRGGTNGGADPVGNDRQRAVCVDRDKDGHGDGCLSGPDCDDHDPKVQTGCLRCAEPSRGCACAEGTAPVQCFLDKTEAEDGTPMCHEGSLYCRDGVWSGCEGIHSYPLPEHATNELIDPDAGAVRCNDCAVNCYRITDNLDPVDGGLDGNGSNVGWAPGGGLTLGHLPDAGTPDASIVYPPEIPPCTPNTGLDPDCDGIPNAFDPYPNDPPFATNNPAIFLDIAPGQTGRGTIDLGFSLNSADLYFLVDQSGSMAEERDRLKQDLTTGDFIQDANYDCSDYDFDYVPNNELKTQGIIGAVRCMIRDTNFGTGLFREIPFTPYCGSTQTTDHIAFANYQDITDDVSDVRAAINRLNTIGNSDWPEASMLALNSVLTGNGMYFGTTRRGVPPREDCPENTWGYPCFRSGAIPIVVMFTDAQFHNGPDNNDFAYASSLGVTAGSGDRYYPIVNDNESFTTVEDLGDLTSDLKTFTGDTTNMHADLSANVFSCLSSSDGPDAVFQFTLTQQRPVVIESTGSQFDSVIALYNALPGSPTDIAAADNLNETGATAYDIGDVYDTYIRTSGNTAAMAADYQWSDVTCGAAGTAQDAVFKFNLSSDARVSLDASGSSFDTVMALYSGVPTLPPTYAAITDTNEEYNTAYLVGDVYNQIMAFSGNTAAMTIDYSAAQVGCNADNDSNDAVYRFDVSSPTRIQISTEGSSYDTVMGLYDGLANPLGNAAIAPTNEVQTSAYNAGTLNDRIFTLTGNTSTMAADIGRTPVGCNSNDYAPDAVFQFHLDAPADVQIDSIGTSWDSVLSLHNQNVDANTTFSDATNVNDTLATAWDLGTLNAREVRMLGATTNVSAIDADYGSSNYSCGFGTLGTSSPDAAYKFHLDTATLVRIDMAGSSFDTVLSLQKTPPAEPSTPLSCTGNDTQVYAADVGDVYHRSFQRTGTSASLAHDYNVGCDAGSTAKDAVLKFSLSAATTVQIDTEGSDFDTVLGLYPETIETEPSTVAVTGNGTHATAYNMGALKSQWYKFSGTTAGGGPEWSDLDCGADNAADDVFYKFTLTSARTINIDTTGSSFDTVISLYRYTNAGLTTWSDQTCNHDNNADESITATLNAGTYFLVVKGDRSSDEGAYEISFRDTSIGNQLDCDDDGGSVGTSSRITRSLTAGTYHLVVSGKGSTSSGNYTVRFRDSTYWATFGEIECDNDDGSGATSLIERQLDAGDYWFFVKGYSSSSKGAYALRVTDVNPPPETIPAITCDDDSGGSLAARITRTAMPAGDYWVVLKGDNDNDSGAYTVHIRDMNATAGGSTITCDDDSGETPHAAVIERNFDPGSYQVILKGDGPSDEGPYKIAFRDVTRHPFNRVACDDDGGADVSSYLEQNLTAGDYYVTMKGKGSGATNSGAYSLSVRDATNRPLSSQFCDDNSSTHSTSRIAQTLDAGTYYVALKGKDANAKGPYQLTVGGGTTHAGSYAPPTWSQTLSALQSTGAYVIPILSCHDDPTHGDDDGDCVETRAQAISLANASHAFGENLSPLVFDIDGDGQGLSTTVVEAIAELAEYLKMNVRVVVIFEPDENPGFIVNVTAIDQPGDGCNGLIGVEHQNCTPGASPRFQIDIENPLGAPVPPNPADPNGGYRFRADLVGDDQFVIDSVPIYVIPEDVIPNMGPPTPEYYEEGHYTQDVSSPGCAGNNLPDWRDLSWDADVYANTTVTFSACAAADEMALNTCTPHVIASVTGGGPCTTTSDCTKGYCDTDIGVCQIARAGACTDSAQCSLNAYCDIAAGLCTFNSQPAYVGGSLGDENFKNFIRMNIGLSATEPFDEPPTVHSWEMTYYCNNVL